MSGERRVHYEADSWASVAIYNLRLCSAVYFHLVSLLTHIRRDCLSSALISGDVTKNRRALNTDRSSYGVFRMCCIMWHDNVRWWGMASRVGFLQPGYLTPRAGYDEFFCGHPNRISLPPVRDNLPNLFSLSRREVLTDMETKHLEGRIHYSRVSCGGNEIECRGWVDMQSATAFCGFSFVLEVTRAENNAIFTSKENKENTQTLYDTSTFDDSNKPNT